MFFRRGFRRICSIPSSYLVRMNPKPYFSTFYDNKKKDSLTLCESYIFLYCHKPQSCFENIGEKIEELFLQRIQPTILKNFFYLCLRIVGVTHFKFIFEMCNEKGIR